MDKKDADLPQVLVHLSEHAITALGTGTAKYETLTQEMMAEAERYCSDRDLPPAAMQAALNWATSPELVCLIGLRTFMSFDQIGATVSQLCAPGTSAELALGHLKMITGMQRYFDQNYAVRLFHKRVSRGQEKTAAPLCSPAVALEASVSPCPMSPPAQPTQGVEQPSRSPSPSQLSPTRTVVQQQDVKHIVTLAADIQNPLLIVGKNIELVRQSYANGKSAFYELVCDKRRPFIADQMTTQTLSGMKMPRNALGVVTSIVKMMAQHEFCGFPEGSEIILMAVSIRTTYSDPAQPLLPPLQPLQPQQIQALQQQIHTVMDSTPVPLTAGRSSASSPALLPSRKLLMPDFPRTKSPVYECADVPVVPSSWTEQDGGDVPVAASKQSRRGGKIHFLFRK